MPQSPFGGGARDSHWPFRSLERHRSATITGNVAPGYSLGEAINFLESTAQRVLPTTVRYDFSGESRKFKEAGSSLLFVFVLGLGFIFLVLAAQFESFVDPLIIMLTVPLSMTGALLALNLTGGTLNIYSEIGLVTLIGLISKHGILIVQFANSLQAEGKPLREAVIEAAVLRLRPILMTTSAMVAGGAAASHRRRRRRGKPAGNRLSHRRRHDLRHASDFVCCAHGLHAAGQRPFQDVCSQPFGC